MTTKDIKYWLAEKELKTPEHDKLVLYSFNNVESILKELDILPVVEGAYFIDNKEIVERRDNGDDDEEKNIYCGKWDWNKNKYIINEDYFINEIKNIKEELEELELDFTNKYNIPIKYKYVYNFELDIEGDIFKYTNEDYENEKMMEKKEKKREDKKEVEKKKRVFESCKKEFKEVKEFKIKVEKDFKKFTDLRNKKEKIYNIYKKIEEVIKTNNNWVVGAIDLRADINILNSKITTNYFAENYLNIDRGEECYFFEIKPQIKSIGETMRQINYYRSFIKGVFILVTKTFGLKDIFKSQDVYVYEYIKEGDKQKKLF